MTNYNLEKTDIEKGLSSVFQSAFNGMCEEIDKAQRADIAVAYHLYRMSKCDDDIKRLGYKNVTELAVDRFDFKASTVRNYVNIGSFCKEIAVSTGKKAHKKIVTCFYDSENDRDFSRSQMNELQAISINELTYKYKNSDEYDKRKAFDSFNTAIESVNNPYAMSCATLRRYKDYIVALSKHGEIVDSSEKISALTAYVNDTVSMDKMLYMNNGTFSKNEQLLKANAQNTDGGQNAQNTDSGQNAQNTDGGQNAQNTDGGQNAQNTDGGQNAQNTDGGQNAQNTDGGQNAQMTSAQILIHVTEIMQNAQTYMNSAEFDNLCEDLIDMISNF